MSARVSLDDQIAAVRESAHIVRVSAEYHQAAFSARASGLEAALTTLEWLQRHEGAIKAALGAKPFSETRRRAFKDLPLATQASLRCQDAAFQNFIGAADTEAAAVSVRASCNVSSRAEFDRDPAAGQRWRELDWRFGAWMSGEGGE